MRALPETVLSTGSSSPFSRLGHRWVWPRAAGLGLGEACPALEAHAGVPGCHASKRLNDPGPQGAGGLASCAELSEQCESSHSTPECSPRPRRREVGLPGELGSGGGLETMQPGRALPGAPRAACRSAAAKPWLTPRPIPAFPPAPLSSGRRPTPHRSWGLWAPNGHRQLRQGLVSVTPG